MKSPYARALALLAIGLIWDCGQLSAATPEFGAGQFVQANGVDIQVPGYSVPSMADWNGDGLPDLIVGEGGGGNTGKIRVYLNVGTLAEPLFRDFSYVLSNGLDLTCTPTGCMGCFPRVVDWDKDGRIDLLVGQADGTIRIFSNYTLVGLPLFDAGPKITTANGAGNVDLDVGDRATPFMVDWNNDGMQDIVSGGLDGAIHVYTNCGCGDTGGVPPQFLRSPAAGVLVQENGRNLLVPGGRSSPVIADLDGDGKKDILTGNTDGQILFYRNTGSDADPNFSGPSQVISAGSPIQLAGSLRTRPSLCHWSGKADAADVRWDLLVGYGDGKVRLYRNASSGGTTPSGPLAGDFDSDGDIDGDDFTILAKALDRPAQHGEDALDLNHDGLIDSHDLRIFADLWLAVHK